MSTDTTYQFHVYIFLIFCSTSFATIVDIHSGIVHTVDKYFISSALDFTLLDPNTHWAQFNFSSPKLRTLLKAFSPSIIRLGGSPADCTYFAQSRDQLAASGIQPTPFIITRDDVDNLISLTQDTGTRFLYDFNLQLRYGKQWDPFNAITLLDYLQQKGYGRNIDFELGNEPDEFSHPGQIQPSGKQIGNDFISLYSILENYNNLIHSRLVGPDVVGLEGSYGVQLLTDFLTTAGNVLDAITFHHYYFRGDIANWKQYVDPANFQNLANTITTVQNVRNATKTNYVPMWIGETSDSWHGGTPGVTDRYISSFLWLEKLGLSAKMGVDVVIRQTLYGLNYSLLTLDNLDPNPDFWASVLHKRLVGRHVINTTLSSQSPYVRVYIHCANSDTPGIPVGAVTLFALNVSPNITDTITFNQYFGPTGQLYLCTPGDDGDLLSHFVAVNGISLKLSDDDQLPVIKPITVSLMDGVSLPPYSYLFLVLPDAQLRACF